MKPSVQTARLLRAIDKLRTQEIDVSQKSIGRIAGLTQSSVSQIFNGDRNFPLTKLPELCRAFNINPSYILNGELPMFGKPKIQSQNVAELFELIQKCFSEIDSLKREVRSMKKARRD